MDESRFLSGFQESLLELKRRLALLETKEYGVGGTGVSDFTDLGDVPGSYTGNSLKIVIVNSGETALEFSTVATLERVNARNATGLSLYDDGGNLAFFIEDGGSVGFGGITNPNGLWEFSGVDGSIAPLRFTAFGTGVAPNFGIYGPRGTRETPSANLSGDILGSISFGGWDTNISNGAQIRAVAAADWGTAGDTSDNPTDLVILTVPDGSGTLTEVAKFTSTRRFMVGSLGTANALIHAVAPSGGGTILAVSASGNAAGLAAHRPDSGWIRTHAGGSGLMSLLYEKGKTLSIVEAGAGSNPYDDTYASTTNRIRIDTNGNVGIPTTNPASRLHIYEDTANVGATAGLTIEQDGAGDALIQYLLTGGQRWVAGIDNSDSDVYAISATADLANKLFRLTTAGLLDIKAGSSSGTEARVGGILFVSSTPTGNVGIGEDNLLVYTVPASTLAVNNDLIEFTASGTSANTGVGKTLRVRFGSDQVISVILGSGSAYVWTIYGQIIRTGATTQTAHATFISQFGSQTAVTTGLTRTLSGTVDLRITGEAVNNDDLVCNTLTVKYYPNNI